MVFTAGKLCDPCLSTLKWFVYHATCYTSARLFILDLYLHLFHLCTVAFCQPNFTH